MKKLTPEEKKVILSKATERPFTGKYDHFNEEGTYSCKQCGELLYRAADKFDSGSGWPSFDDEIPGAIKRVEEADGRTEIICAHCGAHLGHIFLGENFTVKNARHCVNSISLEFIPKNELKKSVEQDLEGKENKRETAIFAGGCFWEVEYQMKQLPGIISVQSGYIGGTTSNPSYEEVCNHQTGHAEALQIIFDPSKVSYETLAKRFFEIHDLQQLNRQGPDIGDQYRSAIFYTTQEQKEIALKLINLLQEKGYKVATRLTPAPIFWPAEDRHQNYYEKSGRKPYCHTYKKIF
ncbi:bifunctional methionine sulfoxide reductase B/A protein [Rickettsiella endosymbiont of Dermanyssus gallinae]|uniref:bifunctional methionine sulfoxide reductase B/A protein n=1 Tax=Rickettsiella endosymbiont of Dermanyssus gallinae TaxID=2856608 RepID=UPI001C52C158|nr:bifunctional methionine sulfoxide reductase B/A protein [Rickettsiella endosymbiont of Dermanyssus gallinae]